MNEHGAGGFRNDEDDCCGCSADCGWTRILTRTVLQSGTVQPDSDAELWSRTLKWDSGAVRCLQWSARIVCDALRQRLGDPRMILGERCPADDACGLRMPCTPRGALLQSSSTSSVGLQFALYLIVWWVKDFEILTEQWYCGRAIWATGAFERKP